ncbi:MAG: hypothetical protein ACR2HV_06930 [Acidimicrobiales bacterium]
MTATPTTGRSRSRLLLVGVVALMVLVTGVVAAVRRSGSSTTTTKPTAAAPTTLAPEPTTTPTTGATPSEPAYITEAKQQVSELRGLAWKSPLVVDVVSSDELARRVRAAIERDRRPEREAGDGDTFKILHLIPADLDYVKTLDDLFSGLVQGYYDPKTKELVVGNPGTERGEIDASTRLTLAHELDHALTDQWFDFGTATDALEVADREEELDGYIAVIEGDAKLLEDRYATKYLSAEDQLAVALGVGGVSEEAIATLENTPSFLLNYLYFPYTTGLEFAQTQAAAAANQGPNAGVDAALGKPPTSTEQILHPERYAAGEGWSPPSLVEVAEATGCERRRRGTLGEFKMTEMLDAELDRDAASAGADGWNGDVFETVRCGNSLGLVDRWQADTEAEAIELAAALTEWAPEWSGGRAPADGRFSGPEGSGRIIRQGTQVDLILADDGPTADRLEAATR